MRIAVVTDSNSGITQSQGKELGIYVVPMPFMINGETFEEDINLTQDEFYTRLGDGADISTSQPTPETVLKLWDQLLEEYDEIVHIPMSSGLSGSCQTAYVLSQDEPYEGKVHIVDNQRISITQRQSALDAKELAAVGFTGEQIREILERHKLESSIYIVVDTLQYLKKGGRITPAAAALGTLLKIKPVLQIQGEKLDSYSKARTIKQAKSIMLTAVEHDLENRYADLEAEDTWIQMAHTCNDDAIQEWKAELQERFPKTSDILTDPLSLSVACHIGPGSLAVACTKKLDIEAERRKYGI